MNPKNCENGLSASMFYKLEFEVDPNDLETNFTKKFTREYILSTGGDYGSPGISIYRDGPIMGAILSTGEETWEVKVMGNLPKNNSWTNIAIRWEKLKFTDQASYEASKLEYNNDISLLGGLQLFLNLEMIGHSLLPEEKDCTCTIANCDPDDQANFQCKKQTAAQEPLTQPTMMIGCHKTKDDPTLRDFAGGVFDEVAFWNKRIPDEEKHMFLGGWKESFDNIDTSELLNMMDSVDFSDPDQAATALQVLSMVVGDEETTLTPFRNIYPTTTSSTIKEAPEVDENGEEKTTLKQTTSTTEVPITTGADAKDAKDSEAFQSLINVMIKLTTSKNLPGNLTAEDFTKRIEVSKLVGDFLDTKGRNRRNWKLMNDDNNVFGSHQVRQSLEAFTEKALQSRVLEPKELSVRAEIHSQNSFVQYEKIAIPEVRRRQVYEGETFVFPMWRERSKRSTKNYVVDPMEKWDSFPESIEIPLMLFSGSCADQDISFVGTIYENFPDPGRKNPVNIKSRKIQLDSRVMTIKASANRWNRNTEEFDPICRPDPKLLYRKRLLINLATKSKEKSRRQLLFHQNEDVTSILKRHCAIWNPNIGMFGAWDTEDIETMQIDEQGATCVTDKLGTYAIIAEKIELPYEYDEEGWLYVTKLVGYIVSTIFLIIFVIIIFLSAYLWEQFHILRMNLAISLIIGNVAMLLGELHFVQDDRHLCTVIGCIISYFYTASAFLLACESHACFKAITGGIIDGRSCVYLPLGWGMPMIALGYNIHVSLMDFGDDPKCFVGWSNIVKWQFFLPLLVGAGLSFMAMVIVTCNLATPAIRKSSILEELSSISSGLIAMVVFYCITWAFGPLAYIRFPDLAIPDFFPVFQVMNSWLGVFVVILLGFCSTRFRVVIAGSVKSRQKHILEGTTKKHDDSASIKTEKSDISA
eukprot:TRINITY_DN60141_c0_g1_i1.p1 TRINITY_DN60141_c0_g1~~TRINITY_DN60141_c0_g1_i1.p1  ORF type:complete len:923 (-),score=185.92 TRINITY_DN60141_c0_g1_i1:73-2841(-)